jgi:hypothetical protein
VLGRICHHHHHQEEEPQISAALRNLVLIFSWGSQRLHLRGSILSIGIDRSILLLSIDRLILLLSIDRLILLIDRFCCSRSID